jgi:hypothetical protein
MDLGYLTDKQSKVQNMNIHDIKLSPCSVLYVVLLSSGKFPGVWILYADVSGHVACSIFIGG